MSEIGVDTRGPGEDAEGEAVGASRMFRQRGALHQWELHFGPNMTPMVDVVMVILIFFMASTAFLGPEWFLQAHMTPEEVAEAALRETDERFALPEVRLDVRLSVVDGQTVAAAFGQESVSIEQLEALAAQIAGDILAPESERDPDDLTGEPRVIISPEADVPYNDVVRAHDACTKAGFRRVGLQ